MIAAREKPLRLKLWNNEVCLFYHLSPCSSDAGLADRSRTAEAAAWLVLCLDSITLHKLFEKEPFGLYADMWYIFAFGTKPAFAYFLNMGQSVWKKRNLSHCHNKTLNHYWNLGLHVVLNNYFKCWSNEKVKTVSPWKSTKVLIILQLLLLGDSLCLRHISPQSLSLLTNVILNGHFTAD